jgi:hypothetical protein
MTDARLFDRGVRGRLGSGMITELMFYALTVLLFAVGIWFAASLSVL